MTCFPRWVSLFFMNGTTLPDPQNLLKGSGKTARHIVLEDAAVLDKAAVQVLIAQHSNAPPSRWMVQSPAGSSSSPFHQSSARAARRNATFMLHQ